MQNESREASKTVSAGVKLILQLSKSCKANAISVKNSCKAKSVSKLNNCKAFSSIRQTEIPLT